MPKPLTTCRYCNKTIAYRDGKEYCKAHGEAMETSSLADKFWMLFGFGLIGFAIFLVVSIYRVAHP